MGLLVASPGVRKRGQGSVLTVLGWRPPWTNPGNLHDENASLGGGREQEPALGAHPFKWKKTVPPPSALMKPIFFTSTMLVTTPEPCTACTGGKISLPPFFFEPGTASPTGPDPRDRADPVFRAGPMCALSAAAAAGEAGSSFDSPRGTPARRLSTPSIFPCLQPASLGWENGSPPVWGCVDKLRTGSRSLGGEDQRCGRGRVREDQVSRNIFLQEQILTLVRHVHTQPIQFGSRSLQSCGKSILTDCLCCRTNIVDYRQKLTSQNPASINGQISIVRELEEPQGPIDA